MALTASPAAAQSLRGWYVAVAANGSDLDRPEQTIANAPAPGQMLSVVNAVDFGWGGHVGVGRSLGAFRIEGQVGRSQNASDAYTAVSPISITLPQKGKNDATRYMLNGYYELPIKPLAVVFEVGAGLGVATVHATTFAAPARAPTAPPSQLIDASQTRFAYQLMVGASLPVTEKLALTAGYRWFDAGDLQGKDARGEHITRRIQGHNYDFGLRFKF